MELRQLEYFLAVAERASFTKAADSLHVSQPAITTAVKNLENELGVLLFVRDKRSVLLTYEGEQFQKRVRPILEQLRDAVREIRAMSGEEDRILRIGLAPVSGAPLSAALHSGFTRAHPEVRLQLLELGSYGIMEAIDRDEIDIGYTVILDGVRDRCDVCSIERGVVKAVMHKDSPLASLPRVSVEQLANTPIISLPTSTILHRRITEAFAHSGLKPNIISQPQQMFTVFNLIQHNAGISFTLGDGFQASARTELLRSVPLEPPIPYEIGFVWKKNKKLNSAARLCVEYARAYLRREQGAAND